MQEMFFMCVATSKYVFLKFKINTLLSLPCHPYWTLLCQLIVDDLAIHTLLNSWSHMCNVGPLFHTIKPLTEKNLRWPQMTCLWFCMVHECCDQCISIKSPGSIHLTTWVMSYKVSIKSSHIAIFIFQQHHTLFCTNILVNHAVNLLWLNIINNTIIYIFHKPVFGTDKLSDINMKYSTMHSGFYTIPYTIQLMTIGIGNLAAHF